MIPRAVTDEDLAAFHTGNPEAVKRLFTGPDDMTNVEACEGIVHRSADGVTAVVRVPMQLEPGDLTKLLAGGTLWVSMWGGLSPFAVEVVSSDQRLGHAEKALHKREREAFEAELARTQASTSLHVVEHKITEG